MHISETRGARWCGIAAASLLAVTLSAAPASAFVITTGPTGTPTQGWDGAGLGTATINFFIGNPNLADPLPNGITLANVRAAVVAAMASWSAVVAVDFVEIFTAFQPGAIDLYWASGDHGDGSPFDGQWNPSAPGFNVFAHAFPPPDIAANAVVAGNAHFDKDELWVTSGATSNFTGTSATLDLQTVILHELGHSLGLSHSPVAGSTMSTLYAGEDRTLSADDIAGVRSLYACRGTGCPGTGPGPEPVPEPGSLTLLGLAFAVGLGKNRFAR
jgi:hypothetical protein